MKKEVGDMLSRVKKHPELLRAGRGKEGFPSRAQRESDDTLILDC